ncbi:regulatory protein GemA [bacterium]|nr:regulatory protein GemA [bacterium]
MATTSQIRKIHTLKNILGLDDDLYVDMLMDFGVATSKNLTYTEAIIFIEILEDRAIERKLWIKQPKKYEELNRDNKMATNAQLRMIEGLWREVCYFDNDKFAQKSLRKFLKNKHSVDDVMFLTKNKASKVIQSIKAMKNNIKKGTAVL